ncbi:kinase-like domain-containing protein [Sporodiniella umbellata]|nr:kinase-like domain-containing protein [Sporodiniella umbellata]
MRERQCIRNKLPASIDSCCDFDAIEEKRYKDSWAIPPIVQQCTLPEETQSKFEPTRDWEESKYKPFRRERGDLQSLSAQRALNRYMPYLSLYEQKEILTYPTVYCVGSYARKLDLFNDKEGNYRLVAQDHLAYRYEILYRLGQGSFGQVVKCKDTKTGQLVAIKILKKECSGTAEIEVLETLMQKDLFRLYGIVQLVDHFVFRNHTCIVFECFGPDLFQTLKRNHFQGFPMGVVKQISYQLVKSVHFLAKHGVIHCDLKPENILLVHSEKSKIRLIDFGTACFDQKTVFTYIQSRFYRAPEVIVGSPYGLPIDIWSTGCVIAELLIGRPLFPGKDNMDQMARLVQILGPPPPVISVYSKYSHRFFDSQGRPLNQKKHKSLEHVLFGNKKPDVLFMDFLLRCLAWDPNKRITSSQALSHPWLNL